MLYVSTYSNRWKKIASKFEAEFLFHEEEKIDIKYEIYTTKRSKILFQTFDLYGMNKSRNEKLAYTKYTFP